MEKEYAKQIIQWAEEAKHFLKIEKEIILNDTTDAELGQLIRMMYKTKVETQNETIKNTIKNTK